MVDTIYVKKFSKIANIQEEEELCYRIVQTESNGRAIYSIVVSSKCNGVTRCQKIALPDKSESEAIELIQYLYENAIRLDFCKDVIDDCINLEMHS